MHVDAVADRTLDLNCLSPVALLRVQLTTVADVCDGINEHHSPGIFWMRSVVGCGDNGLASGIETEVGLVHELLVEGGVDGLVVVGADVDATDLIAVLEKFVEDRLLLVALDAHAFALDGTARNKDQQV